MPAKTKKPIKVVAPKRRVRPVVEEIEVPQASSPTPSPISETPPPAVPEPVAPTVSQTAPEPEPIAPQIKTDSDQAIDFSAETEKPNFFKLLLITIGVALIVAAIAGSLYVYFSGISKAKKQSPTETPSSTLPPTPAGTSSPSITPSPSPIPAEKLSSLKISILNGSGKIGVASNAKSLLEKAGFTVTSTANAQTFDYTDTIIQVKGTIDASIVNLVKQTLSSDYQVKVGDPLNSGNFDIVITVGSAGS
ncbi:MAG: LytR C-terminal domain-containing protein [Candidatus Woesebacteria bacterium]|nr:MAG: LytR C-terminal domain-containing protein [Candidatus Woesebacteria bacterium]